MGRFRQIPLLFWLFVLHEFVIVVVILLGWLAWPTFQLPGDRVLGRFLQPFSSPAAVHFFTPVMIWMYVRDLNPRFLRGAIAMLWLGAISGVVQFLDGDHSIIVMIVPGAMALLWTIALGRMARTASGSTS